MKKKTWQRIKKWFEYHDKNNEYENMKLNILINDKL